MTGYCSDGCLSMWMLTLFDENYWFVCKANHPLQALRFALQNELMEGELDAGFDVADEDEGWGVRVMEADEKFACHSDSDIGPFAMDDKHGWNGTVKQAVDLCDEEEMMICSTAWNQ